MIKGYKLTTTTNCEFWGQGRMASNVVEPPVKFWFKTSRTSMPFGRGDAPVGTMVAL